MTPGGSGSPPNGRGRRRVTATKAITAWLALLLSAALAATAIAVAGPGYGEGARYGFILGWFAYSLIGSVVARRRPDHPIGWIFMILGLAAPAGVIGQTLAVIPPLETAGFGVFAFGLLANLWVVSFVLLTRLLAIFPDGRLPSRRWFPLNVASVLVVAAGMVTSGEDPERIPLSLLLGDPHAAFLNELGQSISGIGLILLFVVGAAAMRARFARSRGIERQQLKWFAYAAFLLATAFVATAVAFFTPPLRAFDPGAPIPPAMFGGVPLIAGLLAIPIAAGVAVLRYRLYDIDRIISRTVAYAAVSAVLAGTFAATILALQGVLAPLTGDDTLAVAGSTLLVAALFQPLRRRVQLVADRRFNRSRYDAQREVEAFAARVRDEVEVEPVAAALAQALEQTIQPTSSAIWLRVGGRR